MSSISPQSFFPGPDVFPRDRYVMTNAINRGETFISGFGEQVETGAAVFLKARSVELDFAGDTEDFSGHRLMHEANVLSSLSHPQVPTLLDADLEAEVPFIVTERRSNAPKLLQNRLSPNFAATVALDLLNPLEHAHDLGIVHRDIKPENLVFNWGKKVALTDFDVAYYKPDAMGSLIEPRVGTMIGTMGYLPPEQARGEAPTPASDLFALGGTMHKLTTGRLPHQGETATRIYIEQMDEKPDFVIEGGDIPEAFQAIVGKALRFDPNDRYKNAGEMREDLQRFLGRTADKLN